MTIRETAGALEWDPSKLSRDEAGQATNRGAGPATGDRCSHAHVGKPLNLVPMTPMTLADDIENILPCQSSHTGVRLASSSKNRFGSLGFRNEFVLLLILLNRPGRRLDEPLSVGSGDG
jgi:hypothetical protein